jgi:hypothetical protein
MVPASLLLYSEEPITRPYPAPHPHTLFLRSILIFAMYLCLGLPASLHDFQIKFYMHLLSLPRVLHYLPILSSFIIPP